jgi:glucans biosynthesis protein
MSVFVNRRTILTGLAAGIAAGLSASGKAHALVPDRKLKFGAKAPFSFDILKDEARRLAAAPYASPLSTGAEIASRIDYDAWGRITFDTDYALFGEGQGRFPVTFFHLGKYFQRGIEMYAVEEGEARPILYDQSYFKMPHDSVAKQLPDDAGFAGFRLQEACDGKLDWRKNDWVAFLGASYFRAIGELHQYGLSARGLALDTAMADRPEEFPFFTRIYVTSPDSGASNSVTIHALLEGPSVAGAYRFVMTRDIGVVMDIDKSLFLRHPVSRFGVAPLTSMYWFSETKKNTAVDWRREVHDSDGLAMWTGWGGRLWRPLNNPPHTMASAFGDENPRGFGLLQRDRDFDHYQDGVHYERRPSLWVEPKGAWGKGAVQLIEIPTDDEIHDNIVAMWIPEKQPAPGEEFSVSYRLHWLADEPRPTELARCLATRLGNGGQPGQPRPKGVRKFMVEFLGGPLRDIPWGVKPEMVLETSRGFYTDYKLAEAMPNDIPGHWRVQFDLAGIEGAEPVEMKLHLVVDEKVASETWMYQYHPF